jgi:hypothetical protein
VAGFCKYGDEPVGSVATELLCCLFVDWFVGQSVGRSVGQSVSQSVS